MKLLFLIPAYNAEATIRLVIDRVNDYSGDILVVDDGSTDDTSRLLMNTRVALVCHPYNKGKGAALRSGFAYAAEHGYELIITIDADAQHDPRYISNFLEKYRKTKADLIIGSRIKNPADMPRDRKLSNFLTSKVLSLFLGYKIEDSQCGYRLITSRLLDSIRLVSDKFELETEIIIKAVQAGFKVRFVPIEVKYGGKFPTAMNRFKDTMRWIKMVLEQI